MASKVKKRAGSKWWCAVEVMGWTAMAGGLVFLLYSLDAGIRNGADQTENLSRVLSAGAALFLGSVLAVVARVSDTNWFCSRCNKPLRSKEDKACLNCMIVLD